MTGTRERVVIKLALLLVPKPPTTRIPVLAMCSTCIDSRAWTLAILTWQDRESRACVGCGEMTRERVRGAGLIVDVAK